MADRQTYNHFFLLNLKCLGTLDRRTHHLSYQSGQKSPPHIFFVFTNLDCFDLGTSLKKLCLSQGSDIAYIDHWPRTIYLFFGGGVPDMPHRFCCEATDSLLGIWSPCTRFRTWSQCCHFGWSLRCSDT